jgi:NADPH:quinone reductase-like Zn-dependent oxidoreductase
MAAGLRATVGNGTYSECGVHNTVLTGIRTLHDDRGKIGGTRMKAAVYRKYGPPGVVKIEHVKKPEPKANEVLIRIRATTVSAADWRIRSLTVPTGFGLIMRLIFGVLRPRRPILGTELAGEIEAAGKGVTKFQTGDQVFAFPGIGMGCHAEYRTMPEDGKIALKPANLSFEEAAAISFGGNTALYYLRDIAKVRSGEKVLVIGASGAVGSAAVQLAKYFGADVTGVCSTANLALVKSIGADRVIDYTSEDFTQNGERYDIIFDAAGAAPFSKCKNALGRGGRLLLVVADLPQMLGAVWGSRPENRRVFAGPAQETVEQMLFLKQLCEAGKFKPVIDQCYPLEEIAEAHARVDTGRKQGSVVVTVSHDDRA